MVILHDRFRVSLRRACRLACQNCNAQRRSVPRAAPWSRSMGPWSSGATLESRLEEMGVLRSFSRPRVSYDNHYSESLFLTLKYRPDYTSTALCMQGRSLRMGSVVCGLVQPSAPPQRHQVRDCPVSIRLMGALHQSFVTHFD